MKFYRITTILPILCIILVALMTVNPVYAHGYLIRAIPEDRAVLEQAPARLQYWFSEPLESAFSSLTVRNRSGEVVATGGVPPENEALLSARLPQELPPGPYVVDMRIAFASDGHVIAQTRLFFIGEASDFTAETATNTADSLEVFWRALTLSATVLLFGTYTLYGGILLPAWGNAKYRLGWLPPRVMNRLYWVLGISLVLAILGNVIGLLQQAMTLFEASLTQVIQQRLWDVVRLGSRYGDLWNARMIFLGIVGLIYLFSLIWRVERPETVKPFWVASSLGMALVMGTFSAGSHAAGAPVWPWIAVFNDWLHFVAVGFWAGGACALALVLPPALTPYTGDARRQAMLAVLKRFSHWATACLLVVIASGIYSAANWIYQPADLSTSFGSALVLKVILVVVLVIVGAAHHIALRPERYARFTQIIRPITGFIPTLRLEALLVIIVVSSVGLLSASPVPVPYFVDEAVPPLSATQTVEGYQITQSITPGGPGVNTYDTVIHTPAGSVSDQSVQVQLIHPVRDQRGNWNVAEAVDDGLYVTAGAEIDSIGEWRSLVDFSLPDGTIRRAAFQWNVTEDAAVSTLQSPRPQHILALLMLAAVCLWATYPTLRRWYAALDLNPATVTIALGATAATIAVSAAAILIIQNTEAQYQATLNPPTTIINDVLPDQASLERGQKVFEEYCVTWSGNPLSLFEERLPRTRDDELFAITQDGWQGLPPCTGSLTINQRWDLVNFIRTLER
jgi:putative copper export protein/methionine-rich copper-binding protein CopC